MFDPIVSKNQTEGLLNIFQKSGADATLKWQQSGHNLTQTDIVNAKEWLEKSIL
jgi:phospholipase/carboxylesterase